MTEQSLANLYATKSDKEHTHNGSEITSAVPIASKLEVPRTIALTGDITGSATFDGSSDISIATAANSSSGGGSAIPGQVAYFAMNTPPSGWLKANGSKISRTTYAALFAAIGTIYGTGDGSTTFTLPDLRGVFPRGWDDGRGLDSGRTFGSYQADMFASHTHSIPSNASDQGVPYSYQDTGYLPSTYHSTGSAGGTETRGKNVALLACIKY